LERREKNLLELGDLLGRDREFILQSVLKKSIIGKIFAAIVCVDF
jgi:hypothetical protein